MKRINCPDYTQTDLFPIDGIVLFRWLCLRATNIFYN